MNNSKILIYEEALCDLRIFSFKKNGENKIDLDF
jgi:hypothetical protein